jgi:hypothetical protein
MPYIIGLGGTSDEMSLRLETRRHRHINNVLRPEASPEVMRERISLNIETRPTARPVSASAIYNCYGLAFASRRCAIVDEKDVEAILDDDGYRRLPWDPSAWLPGDVVIYRNNKSEIVHAGLIAQIDIDLTSDRVNVKVISAWGDCGEYLHPLEDVPILLGRPTEVVAQRFLYDT